MRKLRGGCGPLPFPSPPTAAIAAIVHRSHSFRITIAANPHHDRSKPTPRSQQTHTTIAANPHRHRITIAPRAVFFRRNCDVNPIFFDVRSLRSVRLLWSVQCGNQTLQWDRPSPSGKLINLSIYYSRQILVFSPVGKAKTKRNAKIPTRGNGRSEPKIHYWPIQFEV